MNRIVLAIFLFSSLNFYSQTSQSPSYTISGKITDNSTNEPLEYVTVVFRSLESNELKFGCITNRNGKFSIDVIGGNYSISVEMLSYKTKKLNLTEIRRDFDLGVVRMDLDTELLNEIEITATQKAVSLKPNKTIFNVSNDLSAGGNSASSILNNIPSVTVNSEGKILLRGQENITVMINGRTSALTKSEALESLPAETIDRVEIISNPGAAYKGDAIGIINIILKKGKDNGLNASTTLTGGYRDYYGALITLNHKSDKLNFFTNGSYFHRNPVREAFYQNEYSTNNALVGSINETNENNNKADVFYGTIGATLPLWNKSMLTASINLNDIENEGRNTTTTRFFDDLNNLSSSNDRFNLEEFRNTIVEYQLDFEQHFSKEGQILKTSFTYSSDQETYNNNITNTHLDFTNESYIIENELNNTMIDFSFVSPIGEASNYSFGYSGEFGEIPFALKDAIEPFALKYSEDIHGAFATFDHESEKIYYELGIRSEFVNTKIDYDGQLADIERNYEDFFPSAYIYLMLSDSKNLSLSYSRNIQRPTYSDLQPFEQKISETSSYKGNEKLLPVYVDQLEFSYMYSSNKFSISSLLFFHVYKDYWQEITYESGLEIAGIPKIMTTPWNVGKLNYYGINITSQLSLSQRLNLTGNFLLVNFDQSGTFEGKNLADESYFRDYNHSGINGSFSLLSQLRIPKVFDFQLNLKHFLISEGPYSTRKAYSTANAAIQRELFNNSATIGLTVDDIFKSNTTKRDRYYPGYFSKSVVENTYRTILLSFTYRFNQSKKERKIDFGKKDLKPNY